jgi:hypothetical protein
MPTFRMICKKRIGTASGAIDKGTFIQVVKDSTTPPTGKEISEAVKNQLGIKMNATCSYNDFNVERF